MGRFCEVERGRSPGLQKAAREHVLAGDAGFVMDASVGRLGALHTVCGVVLPLCVCVCVLCVFSTSHSTLMCCMRVCASVKEGHVPVTSPTQQLGLGQNPRQGVRPLAGRGASQTRSRPGKSPALGLGPGYTCFLTCFLGGSYTER